ncbi:MAG: transposase [Desulfobacteraceae bacterium]|nr:transposase [Desulfobacteraceae bacterium]MBC2752258.1 transposase [Desulfobacteraceae bacterium]
MPRQARIDAPGALQHIICRGIERRKLFLADDDCDDFVDRLSRIMRESGTLCYAWALIPNHFHLLLRTGNIPITMVMRRLLTGYAVSFNRRHRRHGRLFQNRYKSILCQEEPYLLELVRYIHLNPLRAVIVSDLKALDRYAYCGHSRLTAHISDGWQTVDGVLALFGKDKKSARRHYHRFIQKGIGQGRRPEFTGGGLVRSAGGWGVLKSMRRMKEHLKGDERVLGDSDFVMKVLETAQEQMEDRYRLAAEGHTFERMIAQVGDYYGVSVKELHRPGKHPHRVKARSVAAYLAVRKLGMDGTAVGKLLGIGQSAVSRAVTRGEKLVDEVEIPFL